MGRTWLRSLDARRVAKRSVILDEMDIHATPFGIDREIDRFSVVIKIVQRGVGIDFQAQ